MANQDATTVVDPMKSLFLDSERKRKPFVKYTTTRTKITVKKTTENNLGNDIIDTSYKRTAKLKGIVLEPVVSENIGAVVERLKEPDVPKEIALFVLDYLAQVQVYEADKKAKNPNPYPEPYEYFEFDIPYDSNRIIVVDSD